MRQDGAWIKNQPPLKIAAEVLFSEKSSGIEHSDYYYQYDSGDADTDKGIYLFKRNAAKALVKFLYRIGGHMVLSFGILLLIVLIH